MLWPSAFRSTPSSSESICSSTGPWHQGPHVKTSMPPNVRAHRRRDLGPVGRQVVGRQPAAVVLVIAHHGRREVAAVEGVARRVQAGDPAARARRPLLVDHELHRAREIRLHEPLALARGAAAGEPDRRVRRPAPVSVGVSVDEVGHHRMHGEALARVADGRGGHVAEAHRPVALQRKDPGVGRRRHDSPQDAVREWRRRAARQMSRSRAARGQPPSPAIVMVSSRSARWMTIGATPENCTWSLCTISSAIPAGDARVDHVAPGLEHGVPGLGGQVVAGGDHVARAGDHRLQRHSVLRLRSSAWSRTASAAARASSRTGPACADSRRPRRSSPGSSRSRDSSGLAAGPGCRASR